MLISSRCSVGPAGVFARAAVGLMLIYLVFFWHDASWLEPVAGLILMPAVVTALLALRARRSPEPLFATGPLGHALNCVVILALVLNPGTAGAAMIFYGASMLVAAVRRAGGCEVTVVSNVLLGRDDQIGCPVFWPVDAIEFAARRRLQSGRAA